MSFFLESGVAESERSAGVSLRIQCLGGENCVLFFFWGERSLSGVLVFLYQIQCLGGENCVLFVFLGGSGV